MPVPLLLMRCARIVVQSKCQASRSWIFKPFCSLVIHEENELSTEKSALQPANQDLSNVTPNFKKSFNIAAYVNRSETLQNLLHLNVNLSKIEKKPYLVEKILRLDFERDMKNHIIFLSDLITMENVGMFITKNPMIFYEDLENLNIRLNYLTSKGFQQSQIQRIVTKNPFWLMFNTIRIDRRLAYFQERFNFCGNEVRYLTTKQPRIITYNLHHIRVSTFALEEEMGFNLDEMKQMLLDKPTIWMKSERALRERFNYIHNVMKIPHTRIVENPKLLLTRLFKIKQRHLFLDKMGRAQYDPKKENYIPLTALILDTDIEFCNKYAKCHVDDFNTFLKSI